MAEAKMVRNTVCGVGDLILLSQAGAERRDKGIVSALLSNTKGIACFLGTMNLCLFCHSLRAHVRHGEWDRALAKGFKTLTLALWLDMAARFEFQPCSAISHAS